MKVLNSKLKKQWMRERKVEQNIWLGLKMSGYRIKIINQKMIIKQNDILLSSNNWQQNNIRKIIRDCFQKHGLNPYTIPIIFIKKDAKLFEICAIYGNSFLVDEKLLYNPISHEALITAIEHEISHLIMHDNAYIFHYEQELKKEKSLF